MVSNIYAELAKNMELYAKEVSVKNEVQHIYDLSVFYRA